MDKKEKGNYEKWTAVEKDELLRLLVEAANNGNRGADGSFSKNLLTMKILPALNGKFNGNKTVENIRSKIRVWKRQYQPVADLMASNSGFGWDPQSQKITAPEEVWEEYFQHHPNARKYRTERIEDFEDLKIVVGNAYASGRNSYGIGVGMDPPVMLEKDLDDDPMNDSFDLFSNTDDITREGPTSLPTTQPHVGTRLGTSESQSTSPTSGSSTQRKRKATEVTSSSGKGKSKENTTDRLLSSVEAMVENMKAIREICERPPPSIDLWKILEETPGLDRTLRFRAAELLANSSMHDMFVKMDPETRKEWILFRLQS